MKIQTGGSGLYSSRDTALRSHFLGLCTQRYTPCRKCSCALSAARLQPRTVKRGGLFV